MSGSGQFVPLSGSEKLASVTDLMKKLNQDLKTISLLPQQRDSALEELRVYSRDPRNADPMYTKEGIETLTKHAFLSPSTTTSRNALRCLCNVMLLKPETRQMFVDLEFEMKASQKLRSDNADDEFLVSRVIFLTTYGTSIDIEQLIDKHHVNEAIVKNLERHAKVRTSGKPVTDAMEEMALVETLKLLFNLTHFCKNRSSSFTSAIPFISTVLCKGVFQTAKPLDPPVVSLVNALLNLDLGAKEVSVSLYPSNEQNMLPNRLIGLLDESRKVYSDKELEESATALVGVIRAVHEYAPEEVKTALRKQLLPTEEDRKEALGKSTSLPSWLLKNSTNPMAPSFREVISNLLFDMSDRDASKFVQNVGYGYASGFLFSKGLEVPQNASEAFSSQSSSGTRQVNPITGQFLDNESQADGPEMTEEEKEREAERLFVLFERLRANGIISAENPVRTAQQEGRFEELPDDYEEKEDK